MFILGSSQLYRILHGRSKSNRLVKQTRQYLPPETAPEVNDRNNISSRKFVVYRPVKTKRDKFLKIVDKIHLNYNNALQCWF